MSEILRDEFEILKKRVDELEAEVAVLKGEAIAKASVVNKDTLLSETPVVNKAVVSLNDSHVSLREFQTSVLSAECANLNRYGKDAKYHKRLSIAYSTDEYRYVGYSVDDVDEDIWAQFSSKKPVEIYVNLNDPAYSHIVVDGVCVDMVGHIDSKGKWIRQIDEKRNLYYFANEDAKSNIAASIQNKIADTKEKSKSENLLKEKPNLELLIGTKWMGIFAAVLIFVAFVMFGANFYRLLDDLQKSVILLLICTAFTGFGLVKEYKNPDGSILWHIVTGCGLGGYYITFLLMNMAFNLISELVLLPLLVIWIAALIIISKKVSIIFAYVCYAGIFISTVLCTNRWQDSAIGLIFYAIAVIALIAANYQSDYKKNYFWCIQFPLVAIYFVEVYSTLGIMITLWVLVLLFSVLQPHIFDFRTDENTGKIKTTDFSAYLVSNICSIIAVITISNTIDDLIYLSADVGVIVMLISLGIMFANNYLSFKDEKRFYLYLYYLIVVILPFAGWGEFYEKYIGIALYTVPMLVMGQCLKSKKIVIPALVYLPFFVFVNMSYTSTITIMTVAIFSLIFMALSYKKADAYYQKLYIPVFVVIMLFWMCFSKEWFDQSIMYVLLCVEALILMSKVFIDDNKVSKVFAMEINYITMLMGLYMVSDYREAFMILDEVYYGTEIIVTTLIIIFTVALYANNLNFSRMRKLGLADKISGWVTGVAYTSLLYAVLDRLEAINYVVSLCFIIMAIVFISIGFICDIRSIRLYGLILSIICVIKLVFFDIHYQSSIYYPIGLFVCGGLCLLICFIYNRIEKAKQ